MADCKEQFGLNDEQLRAVERFRELHKHEGENSAENKCECPQHQLSWSIDDETGCVSLVCVCGATLHVSEPIYVSIEPGEFEWGDDAFAKKIADTIVSAALDPHILLYFDPTPGGFFTYLYGIGKVFELANKDVFPNGFPVKVMRRFLDEVCGADRNDRDFYVAMEECGSDEAAFKALVKILPGLIEESAPEAARVNLEEEEVRLRRWGLDSGRDAAVESLYQSALVTLPDETLEQVRLRPSSSDMHFGLGMYLRNRFVHNGLLYCGMHPDDQSSAALNKLIRYCLPELAGYDLIYDCISYEGLYEAYRYCMMVRGEFPEEELKQHYDILLEAKAIDESNPYSIADKDHRSERHEWFERCLSKKREYVVATLREIWDFEKMRADYGEEAVEACEKICLAAASEYRRKFVPSEISGVLAGFDDEASMKAFDWTVKDYRAVDYLPDSLFERRDLALRAVGLRGWLLKRTVLYQDDDEIVLAAVSDNPNAIKHASPRLQEDRRVLVAAAANAEDEVVFFDGPMAEHNDDDELVTLALKANGMNIAFASERVRGNLEYAKLAWENVHNCTHFGMWDYLSDDLKKNLELALVIARNCDTTPHHFPPIELADNDELGAALAERGDHYYLEGMSRRIKEKYMTEDELERWGRDPYWWNEDDEDDDDE